MWIFLIIHFLTQNIVLFANKTPAIDRKASVVDDEINVVGYATLGQFPFVATILIDGYFKCCGSVISKNYILTVGHCIANFHASQIQAVVGIVAINSNSTGILHNVTKIIVHPNFNRVTLAFDIGLLQVEKSIKLNTPYVDSIQLTDMEGNYPTNTTATVVGYGLNITTEKQYGLKLKFGHMSMYTEEQCNAVIEIFNHSICAANYRAKVSVCVGDSGGPLIIDHKLFGVTSSFYTCGTNIPAVFTRVNSLRSWIMENSDMKPLCTSGAHKSFINGILTVS